jgi:Stress responsive A/B Barrel Domain
LFGCRAYAAFGYHAVSTINTNHQESHMLGHMVYFTLKDKSPAAIEKMVEACKKYLTGHPGTVFFAAGTLVPDLTRPVNQLDFDVALQIIFDSREAHDAYQVHPRHVQFIEENKPGWERVRVFDAYVS